VAFAETIASRPGTPVEIAVLKRRSATDHLGRIRPLMPKDREQILQILELTGVFSPAELEIACELVDTVLTKPDQGDYQIDVYDEEGTVLGYTCIGPTPGTEGTFDLYWIAVHPALHGGGIGGALDAHVMRSIRSRGGRLVVAETSSRPAYEATRAFYRGREYAELARIPAYYRQGDDLIIYGKYLRS
jgi:ribosomal protein S18 acetylase RimI-like enzyme